MAEPGWAEVARELAARLRHHAHCEQHPESSPDPECGFCEDRRAFQLFHHKVATWRAKPRGTR